MVRATVGAKVRVYLIDARVYFGRGFAFLASISAAATCRLSFSRGPKHAMAYGEHPSLVHCAAGRQALSTATGMGLFMNARFVVANPFSIPPPTFQTLRHFRIQSLFFPSSGQAFQLRVIQISKASVNMLRSFITALALSGAALAHGDHGEEGGHAHGQKPIVSENANWMTKHMAGEIIPTRELAQTP